MKHINIINLLISTILFWAISCSDNDSLSGGTTIGNPHTISGVIVDSLGNGISNIRIVLLPANYNPITDTKPDSFAITGDSGEYELKNIYDGKYVLNGVDKNREQHIYANVLIDGVDEYLGTDTMKSTGVISVYLSQTVYNSGRFLFIPGTDFYSEVTDTGYNFITAPAGRVYLSYYDTSSGGSIIDEGPNYTYIPVYSNDTTVIDSHIITMADKPEGPTAPIVGDTCIYLIRNAKSSLEHPIEYRFRYVEYVSTPDDFWINSDTSSWSANSSITRIWPKVAEYKIQAQVRSSVDTTVMSTFNPSSNYLKILVKDTQ